MRDTEYNIDRREISAEEWEARCELAALYRLIAHFRMTDMIDTHISARVPGEAGRYLINRYGVLFHEMRASDLVKVDHAGDVVDPRLGPDSVNRAGFNIHSAVHAARPDVACVVHTHTSAGIAVAALEEGLLPISQHALKFHRRLGYHDYEGIALDPDERTRLVRDLGPHMAMILRNHGLLAAGRSVAEAFNQIYFLERACQAQVAALAGGRPLRFPPEAVRERVAVQEEEALAGGLHLLAWQSALRLIGEQEADYRR
ncbi:class II aldolase/adducin family protein [Pseudomonas panipatensis]|uniref:Ribulose-5-phosphate 4-epimerase/Fuculose-1-phosphate aldolase n=1 Tax=Pseudomonas panipatensis TaxID=428992 RepID=A0A1G8I8Y0_9PSED|nr:class II aldolase/adducin family protein [Pseudomonas panipatensis]SDI15020.1 Ribulose-5-phosphate 4-epimerase/Fuculose-1-phosphate aldolase [Pseudomonas panipatensis]SMP75821.1 Ribulose-5-phosphate 4-epimerase/Fuculose-1-phosphate aldolase [Pseudomonas panipatensis]